MDENCPTFSEANVEVTKGKCKRRQSGILKASRSPLRTLNETDISQKMEQVGTFRRSSRRVSFADTKEIKEFVTDKMIIQDDVENDEAVCMQNMEIHISRENSEKENQQEEWAREMIPQNTSLRIAGMDALLHAPLRTPLQQLKSCEPTEISKHQIFPISGLEVRRESEKADPSSEFQKKIDFKSFLARLDLTKSPCSNTSHDVKEEVSNTYFTSFRENKIPEHQKTIDFKSFLNRIKQTELDENKMMPSLLEKQKNFVATSTCKAMEKTKSHTINNLDGTMFFLDHNNDMEITKCHSALEQSNILQSVKEPNALERPGSGGSLNSSLPLDKAVVIAESDCTTVTEKVATDVQRRDHQTNQNQPMDEINKELMLPSRTPDGHTFTDYESFKEFEQNNTWGTIKLTAKSLAIQSGFPDMSQVFHNENNMDITKSHKVIIDVGSPAPVPSCTVAFPSDKTRAFPEGNVDHTQSCTVATENNNLGQISNKALQLTGKNSRLSTPRSVLASSQNERTMIFSEKNDMDITECHTGVIDSGSLSPETKCTVGSTATFPADKTVLFAEANDMDITQSCTVAIENINLQPLSNKALQSTRNSSSLSIPGSLLVSQNERTVIFSETNDMDITKCHTGVIDSGSLSLETKCPVGSSATFPDDMTVLFEEANDMDITQSCTVAIENNNLQPLSNKALQSTGKSSSLSIPGSLLVSQNERTVIFSETNDMEITKCHTGVIDSGSLSPETKCTVGSTATFPDDKTILFSEKNDMDITKSHSGVIDSGSLSPVTKCPVGSTATFPDDKTMLFAEANDMDITQSCTVAIENNNLQPLSNKALQSTGKSSRLSIPGSLLVSQNERTVIFSETNDMEITKCHTGTIDSSSLSPETKCTVGSSATFPDDKTVLFAEANDMDITQSCTVAIENNNLQPLSNKALQSTGKSSSLSIPGSLLVSQNERTVIFSETNDMEITKCHTGVIDSGSLSPETKCTVGSTATFPDDKTILFSEKNDMDITKSHSGVIDSGSLSPVTKCPVGSTATFPDDKTMLFAEANDMDITQSCTVAIENNNLQPLSNKALQSTRKSSSLSIPGSILVLSQNERTVIFSETNDMDITKSYTGAIDSATLSPMLKCSTTFPGGKNMMFSKANDMNITQTCTVVNENNNLQPFSSKSLQSTQKSSRLSIPGSILALSQNKNNVVFSEANDMAVCKNHTGVINSGSLSPVSKCTFDSSANFTGDKTMEFSEANHIIQTAAFEVGNLKLSGNLESGSTKMTSTHSNNQVCFSDEKSPIFLKVNEEDTSPSHTVAIDCMKLGATTDCAVGSSGDSMVISEAYDMDETKSHTVANEGECHGQLVKLTIDSADSFPHDKAPIFSKANAMDVNKNCTINIDREKPGTIADGTLGSAKITSNLNAVGSVMSSFSHKKDVVFKEAAVTKNDILLDHRKCGESIEYTVTKMTLENADCGSLEADSMCIMDCCEKNNLKASNQSLPCTENSSDITILHTSDNEVQKETLIGKIREVTSEDFVQFQIPDSATCETRTESTSATNNNQRCNTPRKLSLSDESSLEKLNSMTNINSDPELEKPPLDGSDPAYCQIFNAKPSFLKQNSLFKDTLISQISHGVILPKLPSRKNICRSGNSINQNVVKPSMEHHCSDSLLNTMDESEKVLNVLGPINSCQEQLDGQNKMQVTDYDKEVSKMFDCLNPSHCLKSSKMHSLAIHEQQCKETLTISEKDLDSTDQVLAHSGIISTMKQKPFQKRVWSEEENGNACSKRKTIRTLEYEGADFSKKEISITPVMPWESVGHETVEENLLSMMTKSLDSNSSLDSTKADGTSAHAITPKFNLKSSLMILEESDLHKKLLDGNITVREFFMLLKVQTHAQKSRQSELQVNSELDKSSGLENWLALKFVHRPKREVYEEDSAALSTAINDLKDHLLDLDKLLSEVNFPLLKEVMQMTKQELQQLRSCLNTKKATFVKMTKVICLEQKVQLYSSQLNALKAQHQQKKEYEDSLDDLLRKMDDCLASLDLGNLDQVDVTNNDESLMKLVQSVNERREVLRNLQEEHCKMESQLAEVLDEKLLQEKAVKMMELNEEFQELLEWKLLPCQDNQAVYGFLYDSLELTLQYGEPASAGFSPGGKCRKILDIKLVSELDEEAPVHSQLVHELIIMYWKNQDSWLNVHSNESEIPMLLLDLSLVVSRCRLFGDELEYLLKWGPKFDIFKTVIQHTDVKFLISSYDALSKFEVTFHITPGYPWVPLQFTFHSQFGKISGEHINEVLLTVKPGHKYLTRIMKHLHLTLLIRPGADRFHT
ncbi:kinetochore scaffold 1 isoform X2 [Narcine bancroftii]